MIDIAAELNRAAASLPTPNHLVANLTLQFKPRVGIVSYDSAGNEVRASQTVVIKASVVSQKKQPTDAGLPGSGQSSLLLKGRLVDPKYLPDSISLEDQATATYFDSVSGNTMKGRCRFMPATQSRVSEVTKKFGQKIELEFSPLGVG